MERINISFSASVMLLYITARISREFIPPEFMLPMSKEKMCLKEVENKSLFFFSNFTWAKTQVFLAGFIEGRC